MPALNDSKMEL